MRTLCFVMLSGLVITMLGCGGKPPELTAEELEAERVKHTELLMQEYGGGESE